MYARKILNTIINNQDTSSFTYIKSRDNIIFPDENDLELYNLLYNYFVKYNKTPSPDYLQDFFDLEKDNKAYKSFLDLKDNDYGISQDLLALVKTQLSYSVKQKSIELQKLFDTKMKLANTSDIKKLTYEHQSKMSSLYQNLEEDVHKRGLLYGQEAIDDFIKYYNENEQSETGYYIGKTGFDSIDNNIGGIHNVDLVSIGGFVNQGKSPLLRQICYNMLIQGLNCAFISLEMSFDSIRTSFLTLHANNNKRFGYNQPRISTKKVREATLSETEKEFLFKEVAQDLYNNPSYGTLFILQPEDEFCMDDLFMEITNLHTTKMPIDVLFIDYAIPLIKPSKKGNSFTDEDYNRSHRRLRNFGLTFDNGRGLPIFNACQINRQGFLEATAKRNTDNLYNLAAIGQYNAIEKDSSHVFTIIQTDEHKAEGLVQIQHLKSRESKLSPTIKLQFDGSTGWMRESQLQDITEDDIAGVIADLELD